ncbi:hypothetical protein BDV95DRAFT_573072 [Massariosphaeria phaeospora]|uniref:Uncharacterized protein n=1 Tax=Massariosphaeria phaeospora TaxID=100035 RepID=A0A7C8IEC6_9PLEO|nr:hypothetical protein BDV95DRAFT_573072 [Massariosphaeria phaeospora]
MPIVRCHLVHLVRRSPFRLFYPPIPQRRPLFLVPPVTETNNVGHRFPGLVLLPTLVLFIRVLLVHVAHIEQPEDVDDTCASSVNDHECDDSSNRPVGFLVVVVVVIIVVGAAFCPASSSGAVAGDNGEFDALKRVFDASKRIVRMLAIDPAFGKLRTFGESVVVVVAFRDLSQVSAVMLAICLFALRRVHPLLADL